MTGGEVRAEPPSGAPSALADLEAQALRKQVGITQRVLAECLDVDVALVRSWELGEAFPTRAHCAAMEKVRTSPPPKKARAASPLELLGDPAFLAVLRKLMADPKLAERMGAAGRMRAEEFFGWDAIARKTERLYRNLVK